MKGALVLLLTLLAGGAQAADLLEPTPAETEARQSLDAGKYTRAREQAQKILADEPGSFFATFTLASVHYRAEGNHARALFLMRRAKQLLLDSYGQKPTDPIAQKWHKDVLMEEHWILSEMDLREEQLALLEHYDSLYKPDRRVFRIWPLLKLGRFQEAREIAKELIYSDEEWIRRRAYNGLMAIEDEARQRKESYEWGLRAFEDSHGDKCIIASNLALAARRVFLLDESERYVKIAIKAKDGSCPTSPYNQLTNLYLAMGEYQKSLSSLESLRKAPLTPDLRVQNEMLIKSRFVELLHALGQFEEAQSRAKEVVAAPDRVGTTSASLENVRLGNAVLYWTVLTARLEQERERASARGLWDALEIYTRAQAIETARWETRRLALRLAAEQDLLVDIVRPNITDVNPWYAGGLAEMLGVGLVEKTIAEARRREVDYPDRTEAYFHAMEGEIAWRTGDYGRARERAQQALAGLPKLEVLVRRRVQAWLADSLFKLGDAAAAQAAFHEVLHGYPTVLRDLRIAVPAIRTHDDSALGRDLAERLGDSPRLAPGDIGFEVHAGALDDGAELCLRGLGGFQYNCTQTKREEGKELAEAALDDFHAKAFAPKVELTQSDINSLDGRPVRVDADRALADILGRDQSEKSRQQQQEDVD